MKNFGKLSLKGSTHFEEKMTAVLNNISNDIESSINPDYYKCVILIGGYGRGEGGVINIGNVEFPHNNLDFLIISKGINQNKEMKLREDIDQIISKNCSLLNIDFDLAIFSEMKLNLCEPLVITYDMRYGHKVISGDSKFLKNMCRFSLANIPSWDIRNLMVNRGTLLTINDLILSKNHHTMKEIKTVIKHWIKAIIGYGDALLYYNGVYHYSYLEKKIRMSEQKNIDTSFKKLYDEAMNFRFEPNYERYLQLDLMQFQKELKNTLQQIHLQCEIMALKDKDVKWVSYFETAVSSSFSQSKSLKAVLKQIKNLFLNTHTIKTLSLKNKVKTKMLGIRGTLPLIFPYVAFEVNDDKTLKILNDFFNTKAISEDSLKRQYLQYWGKYINTNFSLKLYDIEEDVS